MDMLYKRYSNPLELMHLYFENGQFGDFVNKVITAHNNEINEKTQWEFYIHNMTNHAFMEIYPTFDSFVDACERPVQTVQAKKTDTIEIVKHSFDMLNNFTIEES